MYTEKITYKDFFGNERTEELNFNLSAAELTEMELSHNNGFGNHLQKIIASNDASVITKTFKDLVMRSYGVISEDGRRFIKNDKVREEFEQTEAYSKFYMSLVLDVEKASSFVNAVIPDLSEYESKIKELNDSKVVPMATN